MGLTLQETFAAIMLQMPEARNTKQHESRGSTCGITFISAKLFSGNYLKREEQPKKSWGRSKHACLTACVPTADEKIKLENIKLTKCNSNFMAEFELNTVGTIYIELTAKQLTKCVLHLL